MKKLFLTLLLLAGISQSVEAASSTVTTRTFYVVTTVGRWTTTYTYTYIDFNGNGCLDQWETCVLTNVSEVEDIGNGRTILH